MTPSFPETMTPLGAVNWLGFRTLYVKEVRRFLKVWLQTVAAPVVSTMIFLIIFVLSLGGNARTIGGVPFTQFLLPGLVMMTMMQNAFANSSSSLLISKMQGSIVDVLMPPLNPWELTLAYTFGGATRGILVGVAVAVSLAPFCDVRVDNLFLILAFAVEATVMMSVVGVLTGVWADKFDQSTVITNFVIMPLSFLSGTFYSIDNLPAGMRGLAHFNPFYFMIDGFRAGFTGLSDGHLGLYLAVLTVANLALIWWSQHLFRIGYKLKA